MGAKGLPIRDDVPAAELRRLARREEDRAAAARLQAIAGALEGLSRAEAARLAGMERQALRDAVLRYNAEGLAGLYSRPGPGRRPRLDEEQRSALRRLVPDGPDVEATGPSAWTLPELCREVEGRAGAWPTTPRTWASRCAASACPGGRRGPRTRRRMRRRARRSQGGAAGRSRRRARRASRRAPDAVVHGRLDALRPTDSARRGASAIAGSPAASGRRARGTGAIPGRISSPPSGRASPWPGRAATRKAAVILVPDRGYAEEGRNEDVRVESAPAQESRAAQHRPPRCRAGPAPPGARSGRRDRGPEGVRASYTPNMTRVPTTDRRIRPGISALAMS